MSVIYDETDPIDLLSHLPRPMGHVLRPLKNVPNHDPAATGKKRKRSASPDTLENEGAQVPKKRQKGKKVAEKKALTVEANVRRSTIEKARRRWIYRHRDVFVPLLPAKSLLDSLEKEFGTDRHTGARGYVPLHQFDTQPKLVQGGTMKDYQLEGLSFLVWMYNNGMNCILGDEMGLGKTLQTLSLFAYAKEQNPKDAPHLVVCPLSIMSSWLSEISRWLPSFRAIRYHGAASERACLKDDMREDRVDFDICVTTYEAFRADHSWFKTRRWTCLVLDEGHKIKNSETGISSRLQGFGSLYRLILTGTPIHNDLKELWSLLHFLYPTTFTPQTERLFAQSFDLSRGLYSSTFTTAARKLLETIMLRRTKATVELSVPPHEEMTIYVPMSEAQRFWTYRLLTRIDTMTVEEIFKADLAKVEADPGRTEIREYLSAQLQKTQSGEQGLWKKLMNLLMQLRKVCDHPYLLDGAEPESYYIGEHIVAASTKLIAVDKLLADIIPRGERVLIFSQWTGMLDLLEDFMHLRGIKYGRLDGSTNRARRALDIKLFQQEKSPYDVFLISTKAGGLGINLTKANHVIMFDRDWNPQNDLQAIARAHRIGQTKAVQVYHLICAGSVEDQMLDRIRRKLFLSLKVMGSDSPSSDSDSTALKTDELMTILRRGTGALSDKQMGMNLKQFLHASVDQIVAESKAREGTREAKLKTEVKGEPDTDAGKDLLANAEEEERRLMSGVAQVHSRLFEGKVVAKMKDNPTTQSRQWLGQDNKKIAKEWAEVQKRARCERLVTVDGMQFIADRIGAEPLSVSVAIPSAPKRKKAKFDHEDWCIHCRDGGELFLCGFCPRGTYMFHAQCRGTTVTKARSTASLACAQHACVECERSITEAGGMLFKCQTCPHAYCEDCLPEDSFTPVGGTIPTFLLRGYGTKNSAYYIHCATCAQRFKTEPRFKREWEEEIRQAKETLERESY